MVHSKGAPVSRHDRLILHVGTLTLEGFHQVPLRRRDAKVLRKLRQPVKDIVTETYQKITIFDYELQQELPVVKLDDRNNSSRMRKSKRQIQQERIITGFYKSVTRITQIKKITKIGRNSRKSTKNSVIFEANQKLKPHGVQVLMVKREEKLIGTTASVYYLLLRNVEKNKHLPFD